MNLFTKSLLLATILPAMASAAVVPGPLDAPVTVEITYQNGTLTTQGSSTGWAKTWTSNDTQTELGFDVGVNNINKAPTTGPLQIAPGQSGHCDLTFTFGEGWYISSYSFNATTTGGDKTITAQGTTYPVNASTNANVNVTLTKTETVSITLAGTNQVVIFNDFRVTLSPVAAPDSELVVDEAPADDSNALMVPTNIVNGHFNTFTTWYHILDGKNFLTGATMADAGTLTENIFNDEYLYCAVASNGGYAIYNKAAGPDAPVSGVNLTAASLTVNGAEVTPRFAQKFCAVKVSEGVITRTDGTTSDNAWQGCWTSNSKPTVIFCGNKNNMTTTENPGNAATRSGDFKLETGNSAGGDFTWDFRATEGNLIWDYSFLAKKESENASASTITPKGGNATSMESYNLRIAGSGYDDFNNMASFVLNAVNENGVIISDVYVTVRRSTTNANTREGKKIFPNQGTERRIPAIARVFEGEHAGRLVAIFDLRHHGGDIGFYGNISLQIAVSDDNGETWSEPDYLRNANGEAVTTPPAELMRNVLPIAEAQKDPNKYWNYAFGDAALVADRESGKMLLMAVGGPTSLWNGRYDKPNQCVRWTSDDGGQTWTDAQRVTYDILDLFNGEPEFSKIDSHFIGSGRIMQSRYIKVGDYYRIYAVLASQNNGSQPTTRNYVLYSDDFGQHWAVLGGTDVCPVMTGRGDECKAEELPDGSVVIAGRCRTGNRNFNIFRYTDATAAQGKWMDAVLTDMGFGSINACDGEIMILPAVDNLNGQQVYLVLQSFPFGGGRNFVSIAYKALRTGEDMRDPSIFTQFEGRYRISSGASVYSTMAWQANNKLGFFWEEGSPISGTYLDLDLEEITDGQYSYQPDKGNKLAKQMAAELLEYRSANDNFESHYVGHPIRSKELFDQKVDDYAANPSYKTYIAANKLEYEGNGIIPVVDGGQYRIESAHDGHYNFAEPWYLASDGSNLTTTNDASATNSLFTLSTVAANPAGRSTDETVGFTLHNNHHNKYVSPAPGSASQKFTMTDNADEAGVFEIASRHTGHTVISAANPTNATYPSLHMDGSKNVVTWTRIADASRWYMELVSAPAGYEQPEASEPEYDSYDFDYDQNAPVNNSQTNISEVIAPSRPAYYFDLQGRMVTKPSRGIFITPAGKKVIL